MTQQQKGEQFRRMHGATGILVLPNAWDVASARVFEAVGAQAIATTSGGVAATYGYPDGQRITREEMLAAVRRIARACAVPVTADMEAGYADAPEGVAETVRAVIEAGAVGMNLEDGTHLPERPLRDVAAQITRLRAAREAADATGVPFVLNARTDSYLLPGLDPDRGFAETVARGNAYLEAGADCVFAIGARERDTIAALAREIHGPLNVMVMPGIAPVGELQALGVRRLSTGGGISRAALTAAKRAAEDLLGAGTYASFTDGVISHAEVSRLLQENA